jgi:hypothetical protein
VRQGAFPPSIICIRRDQNPGKTRVRRTPPSPGMARGEAMREVVRRPGSARNSLGPTHGDGERAGEIRLGPLSQERLTLHHVMHGFGDIGRMIAHTLEIFGAKH